MRMYMYVYTGRVYTFPTCFMPIAIDLFCYCNRPLLLGLFYYRTGVLLSYWLHVFIAITRPASIAYVYNMLICVCKCMRMHMCVCTYRTDIRLSYWLHVGIIITRPASRAKGSLITSLKSKCR